MTDNWEDWENDDLVLPTINEKQLKQLEERKLVEESDNALARDLFSNELQVEVEQKKIINPLPLPKTEKKAPKKVSSKQLEHEARQKELSKKMKEEKKKKEKAAELYGEADEDDEYAKYEGMFY